ncbi:thioredoxin family protein [Virgibacillus kimchii]
MENLRTMEQFEEKTKENKVVMYFTADWCPDCTFIEPVLPEIEAEFSDFTFVQVDRDKFIDICREYDVFGIPSFLVFHQEKEVGRFVSKDRKTKEEITQFLRELPV